MGLGREILEGLQALPRDPLAPPTRSLSPRRNDVIVLWCVVLFLFLFPSFADGFAPLPLSEITLDIRAFGGL